MKKPLLLIVLFVALSTTYSSAQYFQELYGSTLPTEFLTDGHNAYNGGNTGHFLIGTAPANVMVFPKPNYGFNVQRTDLTGSSLAVGSYFNNHYLFYDGNPPASNINLIVSNPQSVELSDQSGYAVVGSFENGGSPNTSIGVFYSILDPNNGNPIMAFGTTNSLSYYPATPNYNNIKVVSLIESQKNPGNLIICGYLTEISSGENKVFALKIAQATGAIVWNRIYNIDGTSIPYDIIESPYLNPTHSCDEYLIVGERKDAGAAANRDAFILHIEDVYGNMLNPIDYYGTNSSEDVFTSITASGNNVIDANGEGFVIGGHTNQSGHYDVWSMAIANNRTVAWSTIYNYVNGTPTLNNDYCSDIMERINTSGNSEYYLVGHTDGGFFGTEDVLVDKIDNNGNAVNLGQFTYGYLDADRGIRIDQLNGISSNTDGLAIYSYSWHKPQFTLGGFDHYLIKAYFNGVTACDYDLQTPDQRTGPGFLYDLSNDNVSDFDVYETYLSLVDNFTESQICYEEDVTDGDNSLIAPDPGNNTGSAVNNTETTTASKNTVIVPNPIAEGSKQINVQYEAANAENINIKLLDATGRLLVSHKYIVTKGQNTLPFDIGSFQLASAVYYLTIESTTGIETIKLRVIK